MRRVGLALACWAGLVVPSSAATPETPQAWRAAAAEDLQAIHDILRDNAPAMVVARDSAHFRRWLDEGFRQAEGELPQVKDARGYYFLLRAYVTGFRDAHINIDHKNGSGVFTDPVAWPGFVLALRGQSYQVAARAPDAPEAPPAGARLVDCDGKPVAALIAAHDPYDGDLKLAAARDAHAADLLLDRGDPFVPRAAACRFAVAGATRIYRLRWRSIDKAAADQIAATTSDAAPHKLGLAPWGPRRWWITIPSMDDDQPWTAFFDDVKAHLDAVRGADAIVIDLRGNDGGSDDFGRRLVRLLWGEAFVDARQPRSGPTIWRASKRNRDNWAGIVAQISKSPEFSASIKAYAQRILADYDAALAKGEPTFAVDDESAPTPRVEAGPHPVRARVVMLTDSACTSSCLDLIDEAMRMPNVVQAGTPTSADTIFMEVSIVPALPSGLTVFGYGQKAIGRQRGSNVAYVPSRALTWTGAEGDEAGLRAWLDRALSAPPRG